MQNTKQPHHLARGFGPVFEIRNRAGLTQPQFGAILGVCTASVRIYETQGILPPKTETVCKLRHYARENGLWHPDLD